MSIAKSIDYLYWSVVENTFALTIKDIANSTLILKNVQRLLSARLLGFGIEFGPFCNPNAKRGMGKKDPLSSSHGITKAVAMSERERERGEETVPGLRLKGSQGQESKDSNHSALLVEKTIGFNIIYPQIRNARKK